MKNNQLKLGVLLSYISQFISIASALIYTPIVLRILGQSEFGLYQLVASMVGYLGLFSLGFSSSYIRYYARFKNGNETEKEVNIAKLNGMFLIIFFILAGVVLIVGTIFVINAEVILGNKLLPSELITAKILMAILVLNMILTFPISVFESYISAKEAFVYQKTINILQNIFNPFLTFPLLLLGYGSVALVAVSTILVFLKLYCYYKHCIKKINMRFYFKNINFALLKEMWVFTFYIFINMLNDQINWSVDKFLLGRFTGTVAVAVYSVGAQLNALYLQLSCTVSAVFIPRVNDIVASTEDNEKLTQLFTKVGRIQFVILAFLLSGVVFFGRQFIPLWAGEGYEDSYQIALLLMIPITVALTQNLGLEIQRAKNMHKARSIVYLLLTVVNTLISIPFINLWGAKGAAIGTALTQILGCWFFMNYYYHTKIGLDIIYFWKNIGKILPALMLPIVVGIFIVEKCSVETWYTLCIAIVGYSVIYWISIWKIGMNAEERASVVSILEKKGKGNSNEFKQ